MQGVYQRDERAEEKVYNELYQNQKDFFFIPKGQLKITTVHDVEDNDSA